MRFTVVMHIFWQSSDIGLTNSSGGEHPSLMMIAQATSLRQLQSIWIRKLKIKVWYRWDECHDYLRKNKNGIDWLLRTRWNFCVLLWPLTNRGFITTPRKWIQSITVDFTERANKESKNRPVGRARQDNRFFGCVGYYIYWLLRKMENDNSMFKYKRPHLKKKKIFNQF